MRVRDMVSACLGLILGFLSVSTAALAADATSYTPPEVPQVQHYNNYGMNSYNVGTVTTTGGGHITSNGGPGSSIVIGSASGTNYILNTAWTDGVVSTGAIQDYNNPGYYLDPNSTSNLYRVLVNYTPTAPQDAANKAYVDAQAGTTGSLATNGWTRLPNGMIMQWGATPALVSNETAANITFPIAFPTSCASISLTTHAPIAVNNTPQVVSYNRFGATFRNKSVETVNWGGMYMLWTAYGY